MQITFIYENGSSKLLNYPKNHPFIEEKTEEPKLFARSIYDLGGNYITCLIDGKHYS